MIAYSGYVALVIQSCVHLHYSHRSPSQPVIENTTESGDVPLRGNVSYVTASSHLTTSGWPQATQAAIIAVSDQGAAAEYSRIGSLYETTDNSRR